jgi:hypothetical protein
MKRPYPSSLLETIFDLAVKVNILLIDVVPARCVKLQTHLGRA